jgi:F-type H+-transporting ATPase subunit b
MRKPATLLLAAALSFAAAPAVARAQGRAAEAGEKPAAQDKEEGGMVLWKWANFALLAGGLGWVTARNAGPFFAARSQAIRREMIEAEETRKEAEERAAAVSRRLANLDAEINDLRRQSKAEAEAESERMARRTAGEVEKIRAQMQSEIESAGKAGRFELKRYAAHLAVTLAEQKVRTRMNSDVQDALVRAFIDDLTDPAARAQSN